jgi:aldehyde dehydrogenase (NAD+)
VLCLDLTDSFVATGKVVGQIAEAVEKDVDIAVDAAQKAFDSAWGLNASGAKRSELLWKLAQLMEANLDELAAIESLDNGKTFGWAKGTDVSFAIQTIKYFAGWADKIQGQTIEVCYDNHSTLVSLSAY